MSSAPLTPFWPQPSHPAIQRVILGSEGFTSKSISAIDLPPFGLFAKLDFPPCTVAKEPTYATVQYGRYNHLNLNSDLVYINHSCEPSLIFDTTALAIYAGPKGLTKDQELTFFYPSTEWLMSQPFTCFCSTPNCRGEIAGASQMSAEQLRGMWLNGYIRDMIEERDLGVMPESSDRRDSTSSREKYMEGMVERARIELEAKEEALRVWRGEQKKGVNDAKLYGMEDGDMSASGRAKRRGVSSREMSGEMGGDTVVVG